jgi:hypothetical protein
MGTLIRISRFFQSQQVNWVDLFQVDVKVYSVRLHVPEQVASQASHDQRTQQLQGGVRPLPSELQQQASAAKPYDELAL